LLGAAQDPASREAAIITFLVTGSCVSLLGIGGAFWGLVAGGAFMLLGRFHPGLLRPRG
jgi:benzoate membrane transport protein